MGIAPLLAVVIKGLGCELATVDGWIIWRPITLASDRYHGDLVGEAR